MHTDRVLIFVIISFGLVFISYVFHLFYDSYSNEACIKYDFGIIVKACFIRRILVASNAIQTIDNEVNHLIIYCLNCIQRN